VSSVRATTLTLLLTLALSLSSCTTASHQQPKVRFGLLPILDVIPFFVAEQEGYFAEQGIIVEGVPVKSAQERDALMQTRQIDGQLNDLISTGLFNREGAQIKIVRTARRAYPDVPQFRILAAPNSGIERAADLKGVPIAVSQNTVIEYMTDRLLEAEGLTPQDIVKQEVTQIPVRFELLMKGEIRAACLPDPLGQGAIAGGAKLIVDDSQHTDLSQSVISFRAEYLEKNPEAVRKFLAAWEKAVQAINAKPEKYRGLLVEQGRVPESIRDSYRMPPFPEASVPSESEWQDAVDWLLEKGLIAAPISYADSVDTRFLPG
jgi:NitT/TauT family transport system substrate-binding protein